MRSAAIGVVMALAACVGDGSAREASGAPVSEPRTASSGAEAAPPSNPTPHSVDGVISRPELVAVIDAGLGRFLSGVRTTPHVDDGHFVGFRIESLFPADPRMKSVDIKPGDTVTRVNGQSIEHPDEALAVFSSLRVASELVIDMLRDGSPHTLRFAIVD